MRDCAHQLPVLDDRASAHALHDPARLLQQLRVGDADDHIFCHIGASDACALDLDLIFLRCFAVERRQDRRLAGLDLLLHRERHGLSRRLRTVIHMTEHAGFVIEQQAANGTL